MNQDAVVQALQRLKDWGDFETFQNPGDRFLTVERNYKVEASAEIRSLFAESELRDAITRRDIPFLKSRLAKFNAEKGYTNLLNWRDFVEVFSPFEKQAEGEQRFIDFFQALVDLQIPEPDFVATVDRLARALSGGAQTLMGGNMWVCASYLAFMLRPERYLFVKPMVTKAFFKRLGIDWQRPRYFTGEAYAQLMAYIESLCDLLTRMGTPPRDMIDVQSMLWILEGFPPDEMPKETVVALMVEAVGALAAGGRKGVTAADIEAYMKKHHADKAWKENSIIPGDYALWAGYRVPCDASSTQAPFYFERINAKKPYEYRLLSEAQLEPPDIMTAQAATAIHEAIPDWSQRLLSQPDEYRQELNSGVNFVGTADLSNWTYGKSVGADGDYHEDGIGARLRLEKLGFIDVMSLKANAPLRVTVVEAYRKWANQCGNASVLARLEGEASSLRLFVPPLWLATQVGQSGRQYWWVSLGSNFAAVKDSGFLWAPKESVTGLSLQHNLNILEFRSGDIVFYNSEATVRGIARVLESAVESAMSATGGADSPVTGYSVRVAYQDLSSALPVNGIPITWRTPEAGPFDQNGDTKKGYILPVDSTFAQQLFDGFPGRWPAFEVNGTGHQVWMFQANPKYFSPQSPDGFYDMETRTEQLKTGDEDWWRVTRYREDMGVGDTVMIWQSGQRAGVYAVGEVTSRPEPQEGGGWSVRFRYTHIPAQPLLKPSVLAHPALANLQILRQPQGTNFKVTPAEWEALQSLMTRTEMDTLVSYVAPSFDQVVERVLGQGLRLELPVIRRYHLALKTRGFVILSGISGAGKTWLTEAYAKAVGAEHRLVAVAPNWNTNEDLLGYFNPLDQQYHHTAFSCFLRDASTEYRRAQQAGQSPRPYHLVLDEMNLARVEHYFAKFLSAMEVRARYGTAPLELAPGEVVDVPPNLVFIGTVNVDETTHGFADKVYDRAQLLELSPSRENVAAHLDGAAYRAPLLEVWDAVYPVAPFAFRVLDEIRHYVEAAAHLGVPWEEALDEQLLYKILPKVKGTNPQVGSALEQVVMVTPSFPLCHGRARQMLEGYQRHGFASFF